MIGLDGSTLSIAAWVCASILKSVHCTYANFVVQRSHKLVPMDSAACGLSEGQHSRHPAINSIIHRTTLLTARIPSMMAWFWYHGIQHSLGCHLSRHFCNLIQRSCGYTKLLAWLPMLRKGNQKILIHLVPILTFSSKWPSKHHEAAGPRTRSFLCELERCEFLESKEVNSTNSLLQRLSVVVQRGNAVAVLGCARPCTLTINSLFIVINFCCSYIDHKFNFN